jgi:hypothetical protein
VDVIVRSTDFVGMALKVFQERRSFVRRILRFVNSTKTTEFGMIFAPQGAAGLSRRFNAGTILRAGNTGGRRQQARKGRGLAVSTHASAPWWQQITDNWQLLSERKPRSA